MWDCVHPMWRYVAIGIDTRDDIFHFMNGPDWISAKVFLIICIVSIIGAQVHSCMLSVHRCVV